MLKYQINLYYNKDLHILGEAQAKKNYFLFREKLFFFNFFIPRASPGTSVGKQKKPLF